MKIRISNWLLYRIIFARNIFTPSMWFHSLVALYEYMCIVHKSCQSFNVCFLPVLRHGTLWTNEAELNFSLCDTSLFFNIVISSVCLWVKEKFLKYLVNVIEYRLGSFVVYELTNAVQQFASKLLTSRDSDSWYLPF